VTTASAATTKTQEEQQATRRSSQEEEEEEEEQNADKPRRTWCTTSQIEASSCLMSAYHSSDVWSHLETFPKTNIWWWDINFHDEEESKTRRLLLKTLLASISLLNSRL
jgi:hypothetical protein